MKGRVRSAISPGPLELGGDIHHEAEQDDHRGQGDAVVTGALFRGAVPHVITVPGDEKLELAGDVVGGDEPGREAQA